MKPYLIAVFAALATLAADDARAGTPYSCEPFEPSSPAPPADRRAAAIASLGHVADHSAGAREVSRELYKWVLAEPSRYTDVQRVAIQSRLFRVAQRHGSTGHRAAAMIAMRSFALPPERVARLESRRPFGLESVLGSSDEWTERATESCGNGPLTHERVAGGGLSFYPVRRGDTHALVARMVHVDTAGTPHITGVIEKVELRVGRDRRATACVLGVDDGSLSLEAQRLVPRRAAELPHTIFFRRDGDQLGCVHCHANDRAQGARDLVDPAERERIVGARERLLIDYAARRWRAMQR